MTETTASGDAKPTAEREKNASVTFYLPPELRNRARAAYRSTSHFHGDSSWSDMIRKALLAEIERREQMHNDGRSYVPDDTPLSAGRPLWS
jgi:Centromere-binding protein ParB C-terminal